MKKVLILQTLFLLLFAVSSHAADTSCNDNIERDRSVNYQECTDAQTPAKERAQTELSRIAVANNASSLTDSQSVLCSQCHQSSVQMGQQSGFTSPHGQNDQAAFP